MRLFNSVGPNPRMVRMFMAEKGITLDLVPVDIIAGENRKDAFAQINPTGQTPALELDNGQFLTEITAICEYLDEWKGAPSLIGSTPEERAHTRMWMRRVDLNICEPMANGFRYSQGLKMFEGRMRCIPAAADDLKAIAAEKLTWLDGQMAGRNFICGDKLTLADILLFAFLDFGGQVGQPLDPANKNLTKWFEAMKARPSAAA